MRPEFTAAHGQPHLVPEMAGEWPTEVPQRGMNDRVHMGLSIPVAPPPSSRSQVNVVPVASDALQIQV